VVEIRTVDDLDECRALWRRVWPVECLFDLWEVRACFQERFARAPRFAVAEEDGSPVGLLALSRVDELGSLAAFPGETWQGRTWLEQNKIPAVGPGVRAALFETVEEPAAIRYLDGDPLVSEAPLALDEVGYLFLPGRYGYSFERYLGKYSGRSRKRLLRELEGLERLGVRYRHDDPADLDHLFRLNLDAFSERSYFADPRFLGAFEELARWLAAAGMLRVVTVEVQGEVAAVDLGASWGRTLTVLAGGTDPRFPGVAKLINLHHLSRACEERLSLVDFLCGDFRWKERFRLTPRPLFELRVAPARADGIVNTGTEDVAIAT
jgi:CelD/BcsL family acetyltransferase involved in cellulose biosynthesis